MRRLRGTSCCRCIVWFSDAPTILAFNHITSLCLHCSFIDMLLYAEALNVAQIWVRKLNLPFLAEPPRGSTMRGNRSPALVCVSADWQWDVKSRCGSVSSPPQRMSLEHLFVLQQSAPVLPLLRTPPRPPPRGTSKRTSAAPVLIWDKWDLCSTKGVDPQRHIPHPPHTSWLIPSAPDLHAWNERL